MLLRKALIFSFLSLAVPAINTQLIAQLSIDSPLPDLIKTTPAPYSRETVTPLYTSDRATVFQLPLPTQERQHEVLKEMAVNSQRFALDLLVRISEPLVKARKDFIVSPFSVWSLLLPLSEGAGGNTLVEIRKVLGLGTDQEKIREAYRTILHYLNLDTPTIKVASMQAIFTDLNQPVSRDFWDTIERKYRADIYRTDFHDPITAAITINNEVRNATQNLIQFAIAPKDLEDAHLVLLSSLFFKGQWKSPFNASLTQKEPFYDEDGKQISTVDMMMQIGNFNYSGINELEGHVLELPYGKEDRLSMLLILPKKGVSLTQVARNLQSFGIAAILQRLAADAVGYEDDDVEVYLPKFETSSDFILNRLLIDMGLRDIFDSRANLTLIGENIFLHHMIHSAKIIVDEEGTTAGAVTVAVLTNKATPPKFFLNRPFMYLIIEKRTNSILFYGQLMHPKNVAS